MILCSDAQMLREGVVPCSGAQTPLSGCGPCSGAQTPPTRGRGSVLWCPDPFQGVILSRLMMPPSCEERVCRLASDFLIPGCVFHLKIQFCLERVLYFTAMESTRHSKTSA